MKDISENLCILLIFSSANFNQNNTEHIQQNIMCNYFIGHFKLPWVLWLWKNIRVVIYKFINWNFGVSRKPSSSHFFYSAITIPNLVTFYFYSFPIFWFINRFR